MYDNDNKSTYIVSGHTMGVNYAFNEIHTRVYMSVCRCVYTYIDICACM